MTCKHDLVINDIKIGDAHPVYFIADIAANHDGDIERAKELIYLAAEAGADAASFNIFLRKISLAIEALKNSIHNSPISQNGKSQSSKYTKMLLFP